MATSTCIAPSVPNVPGRGGPAWHEISTEHFLIDTDLEPLAADRLARQLENLRNVMITLMFEQEPATTTKLRVLALRNDEYRQYTSRYSGEFVPSALFEPLLVTSPGSDAGTREADIRVHEIAHYVSNLYAKVEDQPRWFAEGFATYMQTLLYDDASGAFELGRLPRGFEYLEFTNQAFFDELWDWHEDTDLSMDRITRYYETSWAIVRWMFDAQRERALDFMAELSRPGNPKEAWRRCFGAIDEHVMMNIVRKYVSVHRHQLVKDVVPPRKVVTHARTLADADVYALRAMLHMVTKGTRSASDAERLARSNVSAAKQLDAANLLASAVSYRYFDTLPPSTALAKHAVDAHPDNWLAWVLYAETMAAQGEPLPARQAAVQHALALAPNSSLALASASRAAGHGADWMAAVEFAQRAVTARPTAFAAWSAYIGALAHVTHCKQARRLLDNVRAAHREVPRRAVEEAGRQVNALCGSE